MHRTTPTIFLGHCPLPGQANTRISWYKPRSVIVLSNCVVTYVLIKYIYILAVVYLFPYITFSDFSKSYFTFLFSGLTFSHPPPPPYPPPPHTSPRHMAVLGNVHPIKIEEKIFFRGVISLLARVFILLIDTATQEVPMKTIWKKLSVQFLRYAIELLHVKRRTRHKWR